MQPFRVVDSDLSYLGGELWAVIGITRAAGHF